MNTDHHYSAFALDVHSASRGPKDPIIEAHVRDCTACRTYLEQLDSLRALPPPAWPATTRTLSLRSRARAHWAPVVPAVALVIAGIVLFLARIRDDGAAYVGLKGTPAVQVLVNTGGHTQIWDGRSPVRPGDALALRVACEGLARVVVTGAPSDATARLYEGGCPAEPAVLPFTLIPDHEPGDERVNVVLSQRALDGRALAEAIAAETRSGNVWVVRLTFRKQTKQ